MLSRVLRRKQRQVLLSLGTVFSSPLILLFLSWLVFASSSSHVTPAKPIARQGLARPRRNPLQNGEPQPPGTRRESSITA